VTAWMVQWCQQTLPDRYWQSQSKCTAAAGLQAHGSAVAAAAVQQPCDALKLSAVLLSSCYHGGQLSQVWLTAVSSLWYVWLHPGQLLPAVAQQHCWMLLHGHARDDLELCEMRYLHV
jgi:hypothetical protein